MSLKKQIVAMTGSVAQEGDSSVTEILDTCDPVIYNDGNQRTGRDILVESDVSISEMIEVLFKYRGVNYSSVAEKLGMSRQALFRMVKNETLKMDVFLRIVDILNFSVSFTNKSDGERIVLRKFQGPKFKKKINGVIYNTDKLFSLAESDYENHVKTELCLEPVSNTFLIAYYVDDDYTPNGKKKYPYFEIADRDTATFYMEKYGKVSVSN